MLYESGKSIPENPEALKFNSFGKIYSTARTRSSLRKILIFTAIILPIFFVPWTQSITGSGVLTSLQPNQRPQTIHSVIPGRIEKWFVQEGQFVKQGDTIMFISEVKDEYFDPNLLTNIQDQIVSKEFTVKSYMQKVEALDSQVDALNQNRILKLQQQEIKISQSQLKVLTDSTDVVAAQSNLKVNEEQITRFRKLFEQGLISETELEQREVNVQNGKAKMNESLNKLMISRQELINSRTELNSLRADFRDKISKAESEKFATMGSMFDAEAIVTKMQNSFANYSVRSGYYYITSPQDGYITRAIQTGIGETIKEGTEIVSIMPSDYVLAVEMYIEPMNLPLAKVNEKVRFVFDGWPAFVFSGWPGASFGTYGGKIVAIDNFISPNGKYRLLVAPDSTDHAWPQGLRVGAGAQGFALLNNVPIGYELWRQFNGFPPNFYTGADGKK